MNGIDFALAALIVALIIIDAQDRADRRKRR
jgi:hypothetical protein